MWLSTFCSIIGSRHCTPNMRPHHQRDRFMFAEWMIFLWWFLQSCLIVQGPLYNHNEIPHSLSGVEWDDRDVYEIVLYKINMVIQYRCQTIQNYFQRNNCVSPNNMTNNTSCHFYKTQIQYEQYRQCVQVYCVIISKKSSRYFFHCIESATVWCRNFLMDNMI